MALCNATQQPDSQLPGRPSTRRRWTIAGSTDAMRGIIRRFTVRRRSRQKVNLQATTSPNISSDVVHRVLEQDSHPRGDHLRPKESGMKPLPAIDIDATGTRDTTERPMRREEPERPATGTSHSQSFPSTTDLGNDERDAPRRTPSTGRKLQRRPRKSRTGPSSFTIAIHYKRTSSKAPKTTPPPSIASLAVASSGHDEPRPSVVTQLQPQARDNDHSTTILPAQADRQESANAKKSDTTTTSPDPEEVEKLRRDLATSQSQAAELQKRCEAQSRDLESTNKFLHTADKSSDSDVIYALQRLNAEVQQNAMYMADCMVQDFVFKHVPANATEEQISVKRKVSESIGAALVRSFGTATPEDIPMLLQIAFQAFLTSALCETASSWATDPGQNSFVNEIYQRLRKAEPQAVSGHWRSLTRVHIAYTCVTDPYSVVRKVLIGLCDIVVAAGCTASQAEITSKVVSKFENKALTLVSLAGRLNKIFDEVISSDFEVFIVRPGEKFEGKKMEDTDGGRDEIQKASVLCATHLGLIKQIPVGTLWEQGRKQVMMVLKAKVLLESFLTAD